MRAPTVVIAYEGLSDTTDVEEAVLQTIDAQVVHIRGLDSDASRAILRTADAVMVTVQKVSATTIADLDCCRIISRVGVGLDAIDIPAATARGIWVVNVPDYAIDEVSTHAIAFLLTYARRLPHLLATTRQGIWSGQGAMPMFRLKGQTLGVLGFGRIARAVATKGQGLGLDVMAYDPYIDPAQITAAGVRPVDWDTMLRTADYLSLHAPLTDTTRRIIDADALARMKPTALLINTARGELIDEEALHVAVTSGQIAGAALDVLSVEPPPADHPLLHDAQVMITPHIAWGSEEASRDVRTKGAEEVVRVLRGEQPRNPANTVHEARTAADHNKE